jgi:hypothetical protein
LNSKKRENTIDPILPAGCRMIVLGKPSAPVETILRVTDLNPIGRNANTQALLVMDEA